MRAGFNAERSQQVRIAIGEALTWILSRAGGDAEDVVGIRFQVDDATTLQITLFHPSVTAFEVTPLVGADDETTAAALLDDPAAVSLAILAGLVPHLRFEEGALTLGW